MEDPVFYGLQDPTSQTQQAAATGLSAAYGKDPMFVRAVAAPIEIISKWPLRVVREKADGSIEATQGTELEFRLARMPNLTQTPTEWLVESLSWYRMVGALHYWLLPPEMMRPQEIRVLDPNRLDTSKDPYVYREENGKQQAIPSDEVISARLWNPRSDKLGQGIGQPQLGNLTVRHQAGVFNLRQLTNNALPDDLFFTHQNPDEASEGQVKRFREELRQNYQGARRSGEPFVSGMFKPEVLNRSPKDMQFADLVQQTVDTLAGGSGTPPVFFGDYTRATFSNVTAQREIIVESTSMPLADSYASFLNRWLAPRYGPDLRVVFDLSNEPVVVERLGSWIERLDKLVNPAGGRPILSQNEARRMLGQVAPEFAAFFQGDIDGGDEILIPFNLSPQSGVSDPVPAPAAAPVVDTSGDTGDEAKRGTGGGFKAFWVPAPTKGAAWALENKLSRGVIDGVLYWGEDLHQKTFELGLRFHTRFLPLAMQLVWDSLPTGDKELDPEAVLLSNPIVTNFLNSKPQIFADHWPVRMLEDLKKGLAEAPLGSTINELQTIVNGVFGGQKRNSLTVARTEAGPSWNAASQASYMESGVVEGKEWLPNTQRHAHVPGVNGVVKLEDRFVVGESRLLYPGDPSGRPGDIINCGCTTIPSVVDDDDKRAMTPERKAAKAAQAQIIIQRAAQRFAPEINQLITIYQVETNRALEQLAADGVLPDPNDEEGLAQTPGDELGEIEMASRNGGGGDPWTR